MRITSRTEMSRSAIVNSGSVSPMIQEIVSRSRIRIPIASPRPIVRARSRCVGRQALDEHRDEDDVVDAQHDLHDREGEQGDPCLGARDPFHVQRVRRLGTPQEPTADRHYHHLRMTTRDLPVLDIAPPVAGPAGPRDPFAPDDERLDEFRPEPRALPAFFVWTLGCQMNKSDSEEMAGRLLAAGCAEAPSMEAADVVVINTCAIREAAEAKVIGRQGHLNRLKAANPSLRVVMTGCSVRESNRDGPRPPLPGGGPVPAPGRGAGARRPPRPRLRAGARRRAGATTAATTVKGAPGLGRDAPRPGARRRDRRRRGRAGAPRSAPGCRSSTAATRPAPTASSRSAAGRSGAARSTRSSTRHARSAPPATARSRSSARTSTPTATTSRRSRGSRTSTPSAPSAATRTATARPTSPSSSGRSTGCGRPMGRRRSRACGS